MKKTDIIVAIVFSVFLIGCGGGSEKGGGIEGYTPHPYDAPPAENASHYLSLVNNARATARMCGDKRMEAAPPLVWSEALYKAAYEHSEDMASTSFYSHTGSGTESDWTAQVQSLGRGSEPSERMLNNGNSQGGGAENITASDTSAEGAMSRWLASEGHCLNIMNPDYKRFGMAHVTGGQYGHYWTQNFGL